MPVDIYAKADFSHLQMREIRKGLEVGIDATTYADPSLSWAHMNEIRKELAAEQGKGWEPEW